MITYTEQNLRVKVLIFGYEGFSQLMGSILPEMSDQAEFKIVDAIVGSVSEIETHIKDYKPDAVISAGYNAAYLKSSLKRPVLSLEVTESDIVEAITKAAKISKNILLISFNSPQKVLPLLESSLKIKIDVRRYKTPEEARETFHLANKPADVAVVGASLICNLANQHKLPSFLFYSSYSCRIVLKKTIEQAREYKRNRDNSALSDWLLKYASTPVIMVDKRTSIAIYNQAAKDGLDLDPNSNIDIRYLLNGESDEKNMQGNRSINGKDWYFTAHEIQLSGNDYRIYQLSQYRLANLQTQKPLKPQHQFIYQSEAISTVMQQVKYYSSSPSNVLIHGESGTGKELVARAIHNNSPFSNGNFVALNCSAIPTDLFECELFGYLDGAFTGSRRGGRKGLIEEAENGLLFLDEINELALDQQAKLLRFLQERTLRRLGGNKETSINVKLVAASNKPLRELVDQGSFREDLFFRLNVFNINIPPLRMRTEDILCIAKEKLNRYLTSYSISFKSDEILKPITTALVNYSWPGNVRELENVLERLVASLVMVKELTDIESTLREIAPELFTEANINSNKGLVHQKELELVAKSMVQFNGDKQKIAKYLGMSQTTLWRRLKALNH